MPCGELAVGESAPANECLGSFGHRIVNLGRHLGHRGIVHQRSHTDTIGEAVTRAHLRHPFGHRLGKRIGCVGMNVQPIW